MIWHRKGEIKMTISKQKQAETQTQTTKEFKHPNPLNRPVASRNFVTTVIFPEHFKDYTLINRL